MTSDRVLYSVTMSKPDYYEVLGVSKSASDAEIKSAYRDLARKFHPDVNSEPEAQAKFLEIQEAYDTLSDPEKRKLYDRVGHADFGGAQPASGVHVDFDIEDLGSMFDSFFGGGRGGGPFGARARTQTHRAPRPEPRPADTHHTIEVDFATAITGGKKELEIQRSGSTKKVEVTIPAGVSDGAKLRVRGVGHAHPNRPDQRADLILTVKVKPHPLFRRGEPARNERTRDVYLDLPITFAEAALGGPVDVPTPTGQATLTIPAGSASGNKLRLKGQGCRTSTPGDLYAVLQIVPPPKPAIDSEAERVLKDLGDATPIRRDGLWPSRASG
ncbi:MAG TPA: J domain-containing protein [Phycisphaerales bacterium]|nr:J domain-containing protein [Phycisphaerales bacterium]